MTYQCCSPDPGPDDPRHLGCQPSRQRTMKAQLGGEHRRQPSSSLRDPLSPMPATRLLCHQGRRCLRHPAANVPPVRRAVPVRLPRAGHAGGDHHDHEAVWDELRGPTAPSSPPRLTGPIAHSPRDTSSPVVLMWSVWCPPIEGWEP
jgi:hypothetical protein